MLTFICEPCKVGADKKTLKAKKNWHDKCVGNTWCDCQCRISEKKN